MRFINKFLNSPSGHTLLWVGPILAIFSIVIIILGIYFINESGNQKSEENEESASVAPIASVQKEVEDSVISNSQEVDETKENSKENTKVLPVVKPNEEIAKSNTKSIEPAEFSKDSTKEKVLPPVNQKIAMPGYKPRDPALADQPRREIEITPLTPNAKPEKEVVVNQKVKTETKKNKVEEQPKQVAVAPKAVPEKKPVDIPPAKVVNVEPKVVVPPAEPAPVDFVIPEIKDDTGAFTFRTNLGRNDAISSGNATVKTETAVDMAIAWLAIHQETDGHWDSAKYEGTASAEFDRAVTGAAVMAFLSAGQTDTKGEWSQTVQLGIKWLLKTQNKNGSWDARNYTNGICTMAITEAAAMGCGGEDVKKSAVLAVDYILKQQNESGCFNYTGGTKRDDMSVTGWCITALKSGALAGIKRKEIGEAYEKLRVFLDNSEGTKDISPTSKGLGWYTPDNVGSGVAGGACQAIAMFVSQQIGRENIDPTPWMIAAADGQVSKLPLNYASGANVYRIYYSYLTLRQFGGKHWLAWNEPVSNMIINAQRQDGDFRGSWDLNGSSTQKAGRVMQTAFLCLCLEIYYRYPTVF